MLVLECSSDVNKKISHSPERPYSLLIKTFIKEDYFQQTFFKAKFLQWSEYQKLPFCRIEAEMGPVHDLENYGRIIQEQNGATFDKFAPEIVKQANALKKDFEKKLKSEAS